MEASQLLMLIDLIVHVYEELKPEVGKDKALKITERAFMSYVCDDETLTAPLTGFFDGYRLGLGVTDAKSDE